MSPVFFKDFFEKVPIGIFVVDGDGCLVDCNEAFLAMAGAPRSRVIGFDLLKSSKDQVLVPYLRRALAGERVEFETAYTSTTGGKSSHYLYTFEPLESDPGCGAKVLCFAQDVARLKVVEAANEALRISEEKFAKAFRNGPDPMIISAIDSGLIHEVNDSFLSTFGFEAGEVIGRTSLEIGLWPDEKERTRAAALMRERGSLQNQEVDLRCKDGRILTLLGSAAQIIIDGIAYWLVEFRDITERKRLMMEMERQAHTDYLTGLANRRHFMEQTEQELARAQRYGRPLSLLMLDIDYFKKINDSHGHLVGDAVLRRIAETCRPILREMDVMGRIGGEEFAVLLPETGLENAEQIAGRICQVVSGIRMTGSRGVEFAVSTSVGVVTLCAATETIDELMCRADNALYQAKDAGRNCWRADHCPIDHRPQA